jgi:hypothetical protein
MFAAGIAAIVGLILLSSGKAQAADKLGKIVKAKHGRAVVDFTIAKTLIKITKAGKKIYRDDVQETLPQLAAAASKKLGRQISPGVLLLATLMESEAGDQPDLARVAIAHATITNARRKMKEGSLTVALEKLLLPAWKNHKIVIDGHMGSQLGGRYASTRVPPTERDIELAEAIAKGQIQNPAPGAIKWDSPSAQNKLHDEGLYDSDADTVADNRENKEHLIATYLPGIDHDELRLWRTAA